MYFYGHTYISSHMYAHRCIHICICAYVCMYKYIRVHLYISIYPYVCVCMYVYVHTSMIRGSVNAPLSTRYRWQPCPNSAGMNECIDHVPSEQQIYIYVYMYICTYVYLPPFHLLPVTTLSKLSRYNNMYRIYAF